MAFRLHKWLAEKLVSALLRIGVTFALPLLIVCGLLTPQLGRGGNHTPQVETTRLTSPPGAHVEHVEQVDDIGDPRDVDESDEGEGPVDLYGNDVTDAVAKYKLDAAGSLYETHSPQTEIPRLGSAKS